MPNKRAREEEDAWDEDTEPDEPKLSAPSAPASSSAAPASSSAAPASSPAAPASSSAAPTPPSPEAAADEDDNEIAAADLPAVDPLGPLADGESTEVAGSGANAYMLKRTGDSYFCSCPAWRNQHANPRTCKHLKALRGEDAELARLGGDHKAFYATGNRVAGAEPAATGGADVNADLAKAVALAERWDESSELPGWALSEKLDGMRCVWDGASRLWTRTGHEVHAPPSLRAALPVGTPLDGELWLGRGRFQQLISITRRTDALEAAWAPVDYVVFDAPQAGGGIFERLAAARAALDALAGAASSAAPRARRVRVLEHERCTGSAHIRAKLAAVLDLGGEGLCARHPTAAHRGGRSSELLKIKVTRDDEAIVTGHEAGKGKHAGRMGALRCRLRGGKTFKVGTGFSDVQREDPPAAGTVITFRYFELTNDEVPRFPTFVRVRPDVPASDFG